MTYLIPGTQIAQKINANLYQFIVQYQVKARLDIFLVGNCFASQVYVRNKIRVAESLGIQVVLHSFPYNTPTEVLVQNLTQVNSNPDVNAIIIQLPLPKHLDFYDLIQYIDSCKDVDGLHPDNVFALSTLKECCLIPCTAYGCLILIKQFLLKHYNHTDLSGYTALVINRSNLVGQPLLQLLLRENCTVTMAHSYTKNLAELVKNSYLICTAIGKGDIIDPTWLNSQAIVIDIGIHNDTFGKVVGDIDYYHAQCLAITPVPGGVGPMTISMLMLNTIQAFLGLSHKLVLDTDLNLK